MKKLLAALLVATAFSLSATAENVSVEQAKTVGRNFLSHQVSLDKTLELVFTGSSEGELLYYIYNYDHGFVIVAADDRIIPVLGYSTEGPWVVPTDTITGNNVMGWMKQYEQQIKSEVRSAKGEGRRASSEVRNPQTAVAPLLTTTWNQTWPYNELCPGGSMVGCVGVAMAQIMRYWSWPTQGLGSYSYTQGGYGTISADFGATTYNWANMPGNITSSNTDVATICYHAAVSVGSGFSPGGTGVGWYNAQEPMTRAFINYFKYAFSSMQFVSKGSDTEWENLLKAELDASRPVYYRGDGVGSHAWVCDGYDESNYFHMNWGWGGQYNGYFYLSSLNPGSNNFTNNQQAIIGLKPNDGSTITANMTWSGVQSKSTRIAVADGITLTISPGATIRFAQDTWLQIYGTLNAVGNPGDSATLTSVDTNANARWHGIVLDNDYMNRTVMSDNDTTRFLYAKVQYTDDHGLYLSYINRIRIDHSRFLRCFSSVHGGAIFSNTATLTLCYSTLESCTSAINGGAVCIQHFTPQVYRIINNYFIKDYAEVAGGGLCIANGDINTILSGNTFHLCTAALGSGMYCQAGNPIIFNNKFTNNTGLVPSRASLYLQSCNARVNNNMFSNNEGGGIIFTQNSNASFNNNTIVNNHAILGSGINCANGSSPTGKNNILWGNQSSGGPQQVFLSNYDCDPNFYYCDIQGGTTSFGGIGAGSYYTGNYENNLDVNPNFVAPTAGAGTGYNGLAANWQLQNDSPCKDAGTPDTTGLSLPATDIYGNPRIFNNRVDIGAAENQCNPPAQPSAITGNTTPEQFSSQNYSVTNTPGTSYQWTFPDGWVQTDGGTTSYVTAIVGLNPGNITVTPFNSACSGPARTLAVAPKTLFVTPMTRAVTSSAGSFSFTVIASGAWTASSDQPWCTVTTSGTGNGTLTANYLQNPSSSSSRTTNITVTTSGLNPLVISLIQAGSQFKVLNARALFEGLYFAGGVMRQAMDENGPHFGNGISDHVTVELHDSADYSVIAYTAENVPLSIAGDISVVTVPSNCTGYYHFTIRHRNSIETTSSWCLQGAYASMDFDFTTDPWKAWGLNLKSASGKWLIYGGDVNQDGIVDSGDMNQIDNASTAVMLGYNVEDVNGDGIVDSGDMNLTDNNNTAVIIAITP